MKKTQSKKTEIIEAKTKDAEPEPTDKKEIEDEKRIVDVDPKDVDVLPKEEIKDKPGAKIETADFSSWKPKTEIGRKTKSGELDDIEYLLDNGYTILEPEIVDMLLPNIESELLLIGQSKGKFGGGQKRVFRQTQKKTREGNKPHFAAFAVVGNSDGIVGLGYGKAKETVPAREKAFRKAKLGIMKIRRGCGSWQCRCGLPHTIPYKVSGKCGAVEIIFMPAPKGTGLCADPEIAKILRLAGIKDIWSKTRGKSRTKLNQVLATINAIRKLMITKIQDKHREILSIAEGKIKEAKV